VNTVSFPLPPTDAGPEGLDDPARDIRAGSIVAFLFFVLLLGLAAFAPLDAGVLGNGQIAVLGNRQAVQHAEGGVVTGLHVREGQRVRRGQLLVELAAPDLQATERALTSNYLTLIAQRARLVAELSGHSTFGAPAEFAALPVSDRELARQALELQRAQIRAKSGAQSSQQSVIAQRSRQLSEQREGYIAQQRSFQEQRRILEEELAGLRELEERGFASKTRVRALERAQEELRGREAAMAAEAARAAEGIGETRMQGITIDRTDLSDAAAELRDVQTRLSEVLPRLISAREQVQRATVRAPASGSVVGLSVFTVGGVVAPGQTLLEIVPEDKALVIQAKIRPTDADDAFKGQRAQVRFSGVEDRTLPLLSGQVRTVSADSFTDQATGMSYFSVEIEVPPLELEKIRGLLGQGELRPGLPVEVVLPTRRRTALQYMVEPLTAHLWRAFREP
jgi:HlyD family type I secretion membrane fusion protein